MTPEQRRRIATLSPEQRVRFEEALRKRGLTDPGLVNPVSGPGPAVDSGPIQPRATATADSTGAGGEAVEELKFSLFFFSDDAASRTDDKYGLVIESSRFADAHGFHAVWIPERHFHPFGGLYPNPALLASAVAAITGRIGIRAGSVVLPLQHPVRVAEEWSVVDNLSGGRAGIAVASGWMPEDFVLADMPFDQRRKTTFERLEIVQRLWRGEAVELPLPERTERVPVRIFPRPIQRELPVWITTSGTRETWMEAGRLGLNVLTGLLQGTLEQVAENVAHYRKALQQAGHDPSRGCVTLMIHTFVGPDAASVRASVEGPLCQYLRTHLGMYEMQKLAGKSLPLDTARVSDDDKEAIIQHAFGRYFRESGLFGTPATCLRQLARIRNAGVNEIGCLIDFGVDRETVIQHLPHLTELRELARTEAGGSCGAYV